MGSITLKDLSTNIDVSQIAAEARKNWEKNEKGRLSLASKILNWLPVGLVITVAVFYALSAPHTAHILDMVTPGWGFIAPIGFEFALLVIAALTEAGWDAKLIKVTGWLLLIMTIIINVSASFIVVVISSSAGEAADIPAASRLSAQTFQDLVGSFPTLPAATQVALLMVVPIGFAIAVIAKLAGAAIVKIALGKVELNNVSLDDLWAAAERREVKSALMQAALELGSGIKTAGKWSEMIVDEMFAEPDDTPAPDPGITIQAMGNSLGKWENGNENVYAFQNMSRNQANRAWELNNSHIPTPNGKSLTPTMAAAVEYLMDNDAAMEMSGRELESNIELPDGKRVSYRTWNDAKKIVKGQTK